MAQNFLAKHREELSDSSYRNIAYVLHCFTEYAKDRNVNAPNEVILRDFSESGSYDGALSQQKVEGILQQFSMFCNGDDAKELAEQQAAKEAEIKELNDLWEKGKRNSEFAFHSPAPGSDTASIECLNCGNLASISSEDFDKRGNLYLIKSYFPCKGCGHAISKGYIIEECGTPARAPVSVQSPGQRSRSGRRCPKCGGPMNVQTVSESRETGCGTVLLYFLLALTVVGLLIVIPLALRKKTVTRTYAVCQSCGNKILLSED